MKLHLHFYNKLLYALLFVFLSFGWHNRLDGQQPQIFTPPLDLLGLGTGEYVITGNRIRLLPTGSGGSGIMTTEEVTGPVLKSSDINTYLNLPLQISLTGEPDKVFTFLRLDNTNDYLIYNSSVGFLSWGRAGATGNHATFYNNEPGDNETWTLSSTLLGLVGFDIKNKANPARELKYNHDSGHFASYTSGHHNPYLYKNVLDVLGHFAVPSIVNTGLDYHGAGPSGIRTVHLVGVNLQLVEVALFRLPSNSPFEISSDGVSFSSGDLNLDLTVLAPSSKVYVRLKSGLPPGEYNDDLKILNASLLSLVDDVQLRGVVTWPPTIQISPNSISGLDYVEGNGPSASQSFTMSGVSLTAAADFLLDLGDDSPFELSTDNTTFGSNIELSDYDGAPITIYVRMKAGVDPGTYTAGLEIFSLEDGDLSIESFAISGEVEEQLIPSLVVSTESMTGFSYNTVDGGPSAFQTFTISGEDTDGTDVVMISVEDNFEFSLDGINFYSDITMTAYDGSEVTVYVRLVAGLGKGEYVDNILIGGGGIEGSVQIDLSGSVSNKSNVEHLVISQVYGGGGNANATFRHDFVELHNPTNDRINISGWSIQYASAGESSWSRVDLPAVFIDPGQYYLIQLASNGSVGVLLPTPDFTGNINMSTSTGKVALVSSTVALTGTCPVGGVIVDFVGYGTANCYEGAGAAPLISVSTSIKRKLNGRQDTNNNSVDFEVVGTPPRNTQSPINLPIDLLTFTATPRETQVVLDWTYANAEDFDKFEVEHSVDGKLWGVFASVSLLETNVRSVEGAAIAVHEAPAKGINYYRLKLVDIDGTYEYSKIVAVNMTGLTGDVRLVNTVVGQQVHLLNTGIEGTMTVRMTDMSGRTLLQQTHRGMEHTSELFIEAGHLPSGMMIMSVTTEGAEASYKLIKQ